MRPNNITFCLFILLYFFAFNHPVYADDPTYRLTLENIGIIARHGMNIPDSVKNATNFPIDESPNLYAFRINLTWKYEVWFNPPEIIHKRDQDTTYHEDANFFTNPNEFILLSNNVIWFLGILSTQIFKLQ